MDVVAAPCRRRTDHEVDLRAVAQDDARLVGPGGEDALHDGESLEAADHGGRVVGGGQDVEITDRRRSPAQRARDLDPAHSASVAQRVEEARGKRIGVVEQQP